MNQSTGRALAEALVKENECTGWLEWTELVGWVNRSAAEERLILVATERASQDVFCGELSEICDRGLNLVLQVPEQFTQLGKSTGYAEYVVLRPSNALLPLKLYDGSVEIRTGHTGQFDFRIYPHGAIECPRPNQQR